MSKMALIRYGKPSSLDQAAYGSTCIVKDIHQDSYDLYVQTADNEEEPIWDFVGRFNTHEDKIYIDQIVSMRLKK